MPLAITRRAGPGVSFVLVALAGVFFMVALSFPPQRRLYSIYSCGVAVLLLVCGAAAWRARYLSPVTTHRWVARSISLTQWLLTGLIWACPVSLYLYAVVAAAIVGHWPSYGQPDPKDLQLPALHAAVAVGFYLSVLAAPSWAVWFPFCARVQSWRSVRWHTILFAAGVGVLLMSLFLDPVSALAWYAD